MTKYLYIQNVIYGLVKRSFWDLAKEELKSIGDTLGDFFSMIKEYTWDIIVEKMGSEMAGVILVGLIVLGVMLILMALINR